MLTDAQIYEALLKSNLDPTKAADLLMASAVMASTRTPGKVFATPANFTIWMGNLKAPLNRENATSYSNFKRTLRMISNRLQQANYEDLTPSSKGQVGEIIRRLQIRKRELEKTLQKPFVRKPGRIFEKGDTLKATPAGFRANENLLRDIELLLFEFETWMGTKTREKRNVPSRTRQRQTSTFRSSLENLLVGEDDKIEFVKLVLNARFVEAEEGDVQSDLIQLEPLEGVFENADKKMMKLDEDSKLELEIYPDLTLSQVTRLQNIAATFVTRAGIRAMGASDMDTYEKLDEDAILLIYHIFAGDLEALTDAFLYRFRRDNNFLYEFCRDGIRSWESSIVLSGKVPQVLRGIRINGPGFVEKAALNLFAEQQVGNFPFYIEQFKRQIDFFSRRWKEIFYEVVPLPQDEYADPFAEMRNATSGQVPGNKLEAIFAAMCKNALSPKRRLAGDAGIIMSAILFPVRKMVNEATLEVQRAYTSRERKLNAQQGGAEKVLPPTVDPAMMSYLDLLAARRLQEMVILERRARDYAPLNFETTSKDKIPMADWFEAQRIHFGNWYYDFFVRNRYSDERFGFVTWLRLDHGFGGLTDEKMTGRFTELKTVQSVRQNALRYLIGRVPTPSEKDLFPRMFVDETMITAYAEEAWERQRRRTNFNSDVWEIERQVQSNDPNSLIYHLLGKNQQRFQGTKMPDDFPMDPSSMAFDPYDESFSKFSKEETQFKQRFGALDVEEGETKKKTPKPAEDNDDVDDFVVDFDMIDFDVPQFTIFNDLVDASPTEFDIDDETLYLFLFDPDFDLEQEAPQLTKEQVDELDALRNQAIERYEEQERQLYRKDWKEFAFFKTRFDDLKKVRRIRVDPEEFFDHYWNDSDEMYRDWAAKKDGAEIAALQKLAKKAKKDFDASEKAARSAGDNTLTKKQLKDFKAVLDPGQIALGDQTLMRFLNLYRNNELEPGEIQKQLGISPGQFESLAEKAENSVFAVEEVKSEELERKEGEEEDEDESPSGEESESSSEEVDTPDAQTSSEEVDMADAGTPSDVEGAARMLSEKLVF